MRLINTATLELAEFHGDKIPQKYAILSHTWEKEEVSFQEWLEMKEGTREKAGFHKIEMACQQAKKDGLAYLWADTNCIDKSSSAELSEAINSMFSWYKSATVCYAYLCDVEFSTEANEEEHAIQPWHQEDQFLKSKWFTRGWTLQELLAPTQLMFYSNDWSAIGSRKEMASTISSVTRIDTGCLRGDGRMMEASVGTKMSWVSKRNTTRIEDIAYCMLGIFDINMPLLYGEGPKAFLRLQEEIIKISNDQTIFCWTWVDEVPNDWISMFAPCHQAFKESSGFESHRKFATKTFGLTNAGLSITIPLIQTSSYYLAILDARLDRRDSIHHALDIHAAIPLYYVTGSLAEEDSFCLRRGNFPPAPVPIHGSHKYGRLRMCIPTGRTGGVTTGWGRSYNPALRSLIPFWHAFLLVFDDTFSLRTLVGSRAQGDYEHSIPMSFWRSLDYDFDIQFYSHSDCNLDLERGLLLFHGAEKNVSALIAVGGANDRFVLFVGLMGSSSGRQPLPFCRAVAPSTWRNSESMLSTLQQQEQEMMALHNGQESSGSGWWTCPSQVGDGLSWFRARRAKALSQSRILSVSGPFSSIHGPISVIHVTRDGHRMKRVIDGTNSTVWREYGALDTAQKVFMII